MNLGAHTHETRHERLERWSNNFAGRRLARARAGGLRGSRAVCLHASIETRTTDVDTGKYLVRV